MSGADGDRVDGLVLVAVDVLAGVHRANRMVTVGPMALVTMISKSSLAGGAALTLKWSLLFCKRLCQKIHKLFQSGDKEYFLTKQFLGKLMAQLLLLPSVSH